MSRRRTWLGLAAGIAVLLVAAFALRSYLAPSMSWEQVTAVTEIKELDLPDGSKVWLNKGSKLSYPAEFTNEERLIKLEGEAFFEVQKNKEKPFRVSSKDLKVTVLGTAFNVKNVKGENVATVTVREGKVKVENKSSEKEVTLTKNEVSAYNIGRSVFVTLTDKSLNALAWQRRSLRFSEDSLQHVIDELANHYGAKIILDNPFMEDCEVSGRFSTDTELEDLLKNFTSIFEIEIKETAENEFLLIGGTCK